MTPGGYAASQIEVGVVFRGGYPRCIKNGFYQDVIVVKLVSNQKNCEFQREWGMAIVGLYP